MGGLVIHNYYRRIWSHDMHNTNSRHVSTFWRGVLKASTSFESGVKVVVRDGCTIRFWLDHWVGNDTLASLYPILYSLARNPSTMVNSQTYLLDGRMLSAPLFWR